MKTLTPEGKHGIRWTSRIQLDNLDFADDLDLLSQTQRQMLEKATLHMHIGKNRILLYDASCTNQITIDVEDLENV
ncbi:unnamed protein product [Schistosoma margrebowiei]|uniref:Uncharacterized protein n=1 Tax=Schistosoma margrebowiei TaxID=48269 RepID=A0A183MJ15_9TREM|nr:unnamed protein product [Schistosoma margrebowiei]